MARVATRRASYAPRALNTFLATDLANLGLWLKADAITGLADGDAMASWVDSSGNDINAIQGTAENKPVYKINIVNGLPVVRFNGTSSYMSFASNFMSVYTAANVFIVAKGASDPPTSEFHAGHSFYCSDGEGSVANGGSHLPYLDGNIYDTFGTTVRKTVGNPTQSLANWCIYTVTSAANNWKAHLNGTQIYATATNSTEFSVTPRIGESGYNATGTIPDYFYDGDIGEIILYADAKSDIDRAKVIAYLGTKWGIAVS